MAIFFKNFQTECNIPFFSKPPKFKVKRRRIKTHNILNFKGRAINPIDLEPVARSQSNKGNLLKNSYYFILKNFKVMDKTKITQVLIGVVERNFQVLQDASFFLI